MKPAKAQKSALLLSSGSPGTHDGAIATHTTMIGYLVPENAGIITSAGEENGSQAKLDEIRSFASAL